MMRVFWALWVGSALILLALILMFLADVARVGAAPATVEATTETIVVTATPYRCTNGDVLGSSTACPMAVINVGPVSTPTPDLYYVKALAVDGRDYRVYRGWSYADVVIASVLVLIAAILVLSLLLRARRGG